MSGNGMYGPKRFTIGVASYPGYMSNWYCLVLDNTGADVINFTMTEALNNAMQGDSPFKGVALLTKEEILGVNTLATPFAFLQSYSEVNLSSVLASFSTLSIVSEAFADMEARQSALVEAVLSFERNNITVNKLNASATLLRGINAVSSSAFLIANSNIYGQHYLDVEKQIGKVGWAQTKEKLQLLLRAENDSYALTLNAIEALKALTITVTELTRIDAALMVDLTDWQLELIARDELWNLQITQYGANFVNPFHGAGSREWVESQWSVFQRKWLGTYNGSTSLGQTGSQIYGVWGGVIGGVIGAVYGWFSS